MNSPWEILGVSPGCSQAEIKQAYARLLKLHRPDKDPEGFRRIRDAFEWLRANELPPEILAQFASATSISAPETPLAENPPAPSATPDTEKPPIPVQERLRDVELELAPGNERPFDFRAAVENAQIHAVREEWPQAVESLDEIKRELHTAPSPELAAALVVGARMIALLNWGYARRLVDAAYPHLSAEGRGALLDEMDALIQAGKEIEMMPPRQRSTLSRCVAANTVDTRDRDVQAAIREMSSIVRADTARTYFRQRFPEVRFQPRPVLRTPTRPVAARESRTNTSSSGGSGCSRPWYMAIFVIWILRALGSCSNNSSTPSYSTPYYNPPSHYSTPDYSPHHYDPMKDGDPNKWLKDQGIKTVPANEPWKSLPENNPLRKLLEQDNPNKRQYP